MSSKSVKTKILDLIFLVRPPLLWASAAFFFAGVTSGFKGRSLVQPLREIPLMLPNLGLFLLITAAAFIVNQAFDIKGDTLNRKAFILPRGLIKLREALLFGSGIYIVTFWLSLKLAPFKQYLVWSGLALGLLYSLPPVRLKARAICDLIANVVGFGVIGFLLGSLTYMKPSKGMIISALPYTVGMAAIFLNTCIGDEEGDRQAGDRTICVAFGKRRVGLIAFLSLVFTVFLAALRGEIVLWLAAAGALPAFVALGIEPSRESSTIASHLAGWLLILLISIKIPVYGITAIGIYLGSRWYYGKRFDLSYP